MMARILSECQFPACVSMSILKGIHDDQIVNDV